MRVRVLAPAPLLALALLPGVACRSTRPLDARPTLVLDTAFSADEMTQVMGAVAAWEAIVPGVRFDVRRADHAALGREGAQSPEGDTIYFQRLTLDGCSAAIRDYAGITEWTGDTSTLSCVDADALDREHATRPMQLQATVAHELGHSLGLAHDDVGVASGAPESIMTTRHQDSPLDGRPTCVDAIGVARRFALPSPPCVAR